MVIPKANSVLQNKDVRNRIKERKETGLAERIIRAQKTMQVI